MVTKLELDIKACAPKPGLEPMARSRAENISSLLKAVADPTRLQILVVINQVEQDSIGTYDLTEPVRL